MEDMNMMQTLLVNQLGKLIDAKKNSNIPKTPESVLENIDCLEKTIETYEYGEPTGEKYNYLPKKIKTMVLRMMYPESRLISDCKSNTTKNDSFADKEAKKKKPDTFTVNSYLYIGKDDVSPVTTFSRTYLASKFLNNKSIEEADQDEIATAIATIVGLSETRLLTNFGIGAWCNEGDMEEPEETLNEINKGICTEPSFHPEIITPEEATAVVPSNSPETKKRGRQPKQEKNTIVDTTTKNSKPSEDTTTAIPFSFQNVAEDVAAQEVSEEESPAEVTQESETDVKVMDSNATVSAEPEGSSNEDSMSLEEAKQIRSDVGQTKDLGYTLGDVLEKKPNALKYIYNKTLDPRVKKATKIVILSNELTKGLLDGEA